MQVSNLHIDSDSFLGPFDLLCTILLKRELPISDIELAGVVSTYVAELANRDEIDPDTASEFLVLAASLMEIKLRELLKSDDPEDILLFEDAPDKAAMLERLIRYKTFQGAADWLGSNTETKRYWRIAARPVIRTQPNYDHQVFDPGQLASALNILLAAPDVDVRHLVGRHATVHEMAQRLVKLVLSRHEAISFDEAFKDVNRLDEIVAFVAALELAKSGQIAIKQDKALGGIEISHGQMSEIDEDLEDFHSEFDFEIEDEAAKDGEIQIA